MNWFEKVQRYYRLNIYDNGDVWDFVSYKKISQEQYAGITNAEYPIKRPTIEM